MVHLRFIGVAAVASVLSLGATPNSVPPACTLLTATDAAALAGYKVTQDPNDTGGSCLYHRAGVPSTNGDAVEITVRTYTDAASAHAGYPTWVNPFQRTNPSIIRIPSTGVGDEVTYVHLVPQPGISSIYFRSGANNVKMGVYPPVSDSALAVAAKLMISRM